MRPRAQTYQTLNGLSAERDAVPWYWRILAIAASLTILGGFLMLPATFYSNTKELRVSQPAVGIFAVVLLTAGYSSTAILSFAVRNLFFQSESIFLPSLLASFIGLLTVFYDFLIYTPYAWNTPALLTIIAAAISTILYAVFLILTIRKITLLRTTLPNASNMLNAPLVPSGNSYPFPNTFVPTEYRNTDPMLWQEPGYYENYVRNMFPASAHADNLPQSGGTLDGAGASLMGQASVAGPGYDSVAITEEEMQRQQMLQLLLQPAQGRSSPSTTSATFHIDWQGRDDDDEQQQHRQQQQLQQRQLQQLQHQPPVNGYYAPTAVPLSHRPQQPSQQSLISTLSQAAVSPQQQQRQQLTRQLTQDLEPWDGVWRGPPRASAHASPQLVSRELREARRREIESGRR